MQTKNFEFKTTKMFGRRAASFLFLGCFSNF
eukprot:UN14987